MLPTTASYRHYRQHYCHKPLPPTATCRHFRQLPPNCRQTTAKLPPKYRQTAAKLPPNCRQTATTNTVPPRTQCRHEHSAATNTVRPAARLACTYSAIGPTFPGHKLSMCGTLNTCIYFCFHLVKATATNFYCSIW